MRKLVLILILLSGLLFAADGGRTYETVADTTPSLSVSHAASGEWLCEQIYNSDLNTIRLADGVVAPVTSLPIGSAAQTHAAHRTLHAGIHPAVLHAAGTLYPMILRAVTRTADFYLLRLRRLII